MMAFESPCALTQEFEHSLWRSTVHLLERQLSQCQSRLQMSHLETPSAKIADASLAASVKLSQFILPRSHHFVEMDDADDANND